MHSEYSVFLKGLSQSLKISQNFLKVAEAQFSEVLTDLENFDKIMTHL